MQHKIAIVNENDEIIAYEDKLKVHKEGIMHRAFSIFLFNESGDLLIHRRAFDKYHSGGLWTNTCCSHQYEGQSLEESAHSRLEEEMGIKCNLSHLLKFHYYIEFDDGMIENEIDHVFTGKFNGTPTADPLEVFDWMWISKEKLFERFAKNPEEFTFWFKLVAEDVYNKIY